MAVDLPDVLPEQVVIPDLIRSICRLPRYLAHTTGPECWTVGAHCLLVADILEALGAPPLLQFAGLVHDLPEAIYGDMPSPVRAALASMCDGTGAVAWDALRARVDRAVLDAIGVNDLDIEHPLVKRADLIALAVERRDLMAGCERDWNLPECAMVLGDAAARLMPLAHSIVEHRYLARWHVLMELIREDEAADRKERRDCA